MVDTVVEICHGVDIIVGPGLGVDQGLDIIDHDRVLDLFGIQDFLEVILETRLDHDVGRPLGGQGLRPERYLWK